MEVCCTLGMIEEAQARQLREAGLTAYNHNLDTSREFYPSIITTRSYDDRLQVRRTSDMVAITARCSSKVCVSKEPKSNSGAS
jgi:biotin synthase-like enzyme